MLRTSLLKLYEDSLPQNYHFVKSVDLLFALGQDFVQAIDTLANIIEG